MKTSWSGIAKWPAWFIAAAGVVVSYGSASPAPLVKPGCSGPEICGATCVLDPYDVPVHCANGQCACPPGYDTMPGQPVTCQPRQPDFHGSASQLTGPPFAITECPGACTTMPWAIVGAINNPFDIVPVHGTAPGGEAFMPVWGEQANLCGAHGVQVTTTGGQPTGERTWSGCVPDPFSATFCNEIQDSQEGEFNPPSCLADKGCGDNHFCTLDFTSAWPYLDTTGICSAFAAGFGDPARIDFPNNIVVYRAPIMWEDHSAPIFNDDDYTWDLHSPGGELYDTAHADARVHVEHAAFESIDHFSSGDLGDNPFGAASLWWTQFHHEVDNHDDDEVCCWLRQRVNPTLDCSDASDPATKCFDPGAHDPTAVVVGAPSIDCADHPNGANDSEIHPANAIAIRIQEYPDPEKWAFFYRREGNNGFCGSKAYFRCDGTYRLPLDLPFVPAGQVLTSADVQLESHAWAIDGSSPTDVAVNGSFDLANGTVLTIDLPQSGEGAVGMVTVTPHVDMAPPSIACPADVTVPVDLGKCTASVSFAPVVSDNCLASAACALPSGTAFPLGTTTDACTATDQAGLKPQKIPFGTGRLQYFMCINTHAFEYQCQFVDKGDVNIALRIFNYFSRLRHLQRGGFVRTCGNNSFI